MSKLARLNERINKLSAAKKELNSVKPKDKWGKDRQKRFNAAIDRRLNVLQKEKKLREDYKTADAKQKEKLRKEYKKLRKENPKLYGKSKVANPCIPCVEKAVRQLNEFYEKGTTTYSVEDYEKIMKEKLGRDMTNSEKATLARGCIGITHLNLGLNNGNPPLNECYGTVGQAVKRARALKKQTGKKQKLFSKRFYSGGKPYKPASSTGKVNMSGYNYDAKPGYVNFDYGYYDPDTKSWWHANHSEPGMKVYRSTRKHYSRPLRDFDKQVY